MKKKIDDKEMLVFLISPVWALAYVLVVHTYLGLYALAQEWLTACQRFIAFLPDWFKWWKEL